MSRRPEVLNEAARLAESFALPVEPAEDQGAVQARQAPPGAPRAGLGAQQQALPGLVHGVTPSLPSGGLIFFIACCEVFRRPPFLIPFGNGGDGGGKQKAPAPRNRPAGTPGGGT